MFVTNRVYEEDEAWKSILGGTWVDFDAKKACKRLPKRTQNGYQNLKRKKMLFGTLLEPSWGDLGSFWVASGTPKCWFFIGFSNVFWNIAFRKKKGPKTNFGTILGQLGVKKAPQKAPKRRPKRPQKAIQKITPVQKDPKQQELGIGEGFF